MLDEYKLPNYFWAEAINTACYVTNRVYLRLILKKTTYEIFFGKKPKISHLHVFGCKCFILNNDKDPLGKFDSKSDDGIFSGYSIFGNSFRVFNKRKLIIEEFVHVIFDENPINLIRNDLNDDDIENIKKINLDEKEDDSLPKEWR
ncbi:Retrovirus-related Pol polyprotein from transposon TNT 1-94 [Dendrobium catenatum]|uniref:Retrovirus-related Pol polyprotein from transposon TNT 1-94 n=1 Tax=Dendrobium catenatum TaxID=906689 RepID=A0A2I0W8G6_9ASPA|nr:Retrovirus-related Pol polyprotein from transposon TNT 1-94 [Dendrobium catenatum]